MGINGLVDSIDWLGNPQVKTAHCMGTQGIVSRLKLFLGNSGEIVNHDIFCSFPISIYVSQPPTCPNLKLFYLHTEHSY